MVVPTGEVVCERLRFLAACRGPGTEGGRAADEINSLGDYRVHSESIWDKLRVGCVPALQAGGPDEKMSLRPAVPPHCFRYDWPRCLIHSPVALNAWVLRAPTQNW